MVGVPGRSKSCITCRNRKKGCGQQRPSCVQCIKAGLVCGGYEKPRVWVNTPQETFSGATSYSRPRTPEQSFPGQAVLNYTTAGTAITLHDGLTRTAREDLYLGHYWTAYHPSLSRDASALLSAENSPSVSDFSANGWTGIVRSLYDKEPALKYAMFALSLSTLSAQTNDPDLRVRGLRAYATAVNKLTHAFTQPERLSGDAVLAAIRLMGFFEIVFGEPSGSQSSILSPQIKGWHGHLKGEQSLLQLRGPECFVSNPAHQMFVNGRLQMIMSGVSDRRRNILGRPEWKTIPWRLQPKTAKDKILDILADVPGQFQDLDAFRTCGDSALAFALGEKLQADCDRAHADLEQWRTEMGSLLTKYDYTETTASFEIPTSIDELELLHVSHLYWMTCACVYSTAYFCSQAVAESGVPSQASERSANSQSKHRDPRMYAYKIANSVHLFAGPGLGLASFHAALIPLGVALRILLLVEPRGKESLERKLLTDYIKQPYMGGYAGKFMPNIQRFLNSNDVKQV